jgi:hypothetical protein
MASQQISMEGVIRSLEKDHVQWALRIQQMVEKHS